MKRAAMYVRVSTQNQEKEETIQNQMMEIKKRIEADGNILMTEQIYEDNGWSGSIPDRPGLDKMRTDASDAKFEVLYVYDRGRVARKYVIQEVVLEELRKLSIEFISLHDINGKSNEEWLMGGVMGIFHEYERLKITERMRIGKMRKVRENHLLLGYQPKYGYDYHPRQKSEGVRKNGYFTINERQADVVRLIFDLAASGKSKYAIREILAEKKIMPPKLKSSIWSLGTLDRMLNDTTYYGVHYYNKSESVATKNPQNPEKKYRRVAKGSRVVRPKAEWMKIEVPAIIEKDTFDETQRQLLRNKKFSSRNTRHTYLLKGLVYCECGFARSGECVGKLHKYYRCTDRLNNTTSTRKCYLKGVRTDSLDGVVWTSLKELLTQPELIAQQAERWLERESPLKADKDSLMQQMEELEKSAARYAKMYGEGFMSEQIYRSNIDQVTDNKVRVAKEISDIDVSLLYEPTLPLENILEDVVKLVESLDFNSANLIVRKLITKVVATQEEVTIWGRIPLLSTAEVGLDGKYRHCRPTKRRQINTIQRPNQQRYISGKLPICYYRAEHRYCTCARRTTQHVTKHVLGRETHPCNCNIRRHRRSCRRCEQG